MISEQEMEYESPGSVGPPDDNVYGVPIAETLLNPNPDSNDVINTNSNPDPDEIANINSNPDSNDVINTIYNPRSSDVIHDDDIKILETSPMKTDQILSSPLSDRISGLNQVSKPVPVMAPAPVQDTALLQTPVLDSVPLMAPISEQNSVLAPAPVPMDLSIDAGQVDRYLAWKYRVLKK